jgi:hypothetical protein
MALTDKPTIPETIALLRPRIERLHDRLQDHIGPPLHAGSRPTVSVDILDGPDLRKVVRLSAQALGINNDQTR